MATPSRHHDSLHRCVAAVMAAEERNALHLAREALTVAHAVPMAAVVSTPRPPGPLPEAAVKVTDALESIEAVGGASR